MKSVSISLAGLLDYDERDTDEAAFELSVAAEAFMDALSRDYGLALYRALLAERRCVRACMHGCMDGCMGGQAFARVDGCTL